MALGNRCHGDIDPTFFGRSSPQALFLSREACPLMLVFQLLVFALPFQPVVSFVLERFLLVGAVVAIGAFDEHETLANTGGFARERVPDGRRAIARRSCHRSDEYDGFSRLRRGRARDSTWHAASDLPLWASRTQGLRKCAFNSRINKTTSL